MIVRAAPRTRTSSTIVAHCVRTQRSSEWSRARCFHIMRPWPALCSSCTPASFTCLTVFCPLAPLAAHHLYRCAFTCVRTVPRCALTGVFVLVLVLPHAEQNRARAYCCKGAITTCTCCVVGLSPRPRLTRITILAVSGYPPQQLEAAEQHSASQQSPRPCRVSDTSRCTSGAARHRQYARGGGAGEATKGGTPAL